MVAGRLLIGSPADQLLFFLSISDSLFHLLTGHSTEKIETWQFNLVLIFPFSTVATEGILSDILWPAKR